MGLLDVRRRFRRVVVTAGLILTVAAPAPLMGTQTLAVANAATMARTDSVRIPLYSNTGKQRYATVEYAAQTSPDIKTGSATVFVQANVDEVTAWYLSNMPKHGYQLQSKTINGGRNGLGQVLDFVKKNNSGFDVTVTFSSLATHPQDIAVGYTVTDAMAPPRLADSMIPADVRQVIIQYEPASTSGTSRVIKRAISNSKEVSALVHAVNTLPVDIRGTLQETAMYQGGATLQFTDRSNHVISVKVDMAFNRVIVRGTSSLFDMQNHVWKMVSKDIGFAPYPPRNG